MHPNFAPTKVHFNHTIQEKKKKSAFQSQAKEEGEMHFTYVLFDCNETGTQIWGGWELHAPRSTPPFFSQLTLAISL